MARPDKGKKHSDTTKRTPARQREVAGLRVLIAEDSFPISFALELALEAEGIKTIGPAASLAEAMQLARSQELDLAVVDLKLGDEESLPLLRHLTGAGIEVIVATGLESTDKLIEQFPKLTILRKPFSPQALIELIRSSR